jgi:hypothetical protein
MTDKNPFSNSYVIGETIRQMRKRIQISQKKTIARLPEFEGDSLKKAEIMATLSNLNKLHELLDRIQEHNKDKLA